jgi:hypothetical protein
MKNELEVFPDTTPIGDIKWLSQITGWSGYKISRLCRIKAIKGAFKAQPTAKGSTWNFRKAATLAWLKNLENQ